MSSALAQSAGFDLLRSDLAKDIESAISQGFAARVTFHEGADPLTIFRGALARASGH